MRPTSSTLKLVGPGLVTGASDDDPSGIATYSQVGARFGFGFLWAALLCYPLMTAIQEICARIGRVTGKGLAGNLKEHVPRSFLYSIVSLVLVANTINIAADISALGAACDLIFPGNPLLYSFSLTVVMLFLQIFVPYHRYVVVLKWLTLALVSYLGVLLTVEIPWKEVLWATLLPRIELSREYLLGLVAILGTTISPYLFFWQASEEVEEEELCEDEHPLRVAPQEAAFQLHRISIDTRTGMASAVIVFYCIVLTTAVTLHREGITNIETAADAALALRPLAGDWAFILFALGIIGTGLLAIPILAGSSAYALGETLGVKVGLEKRPDEAPLFYCFIILSTLTGLGLSILHISPMRALFWAAIINGVAAGPIMTAVMYISTHRAVMGEFVLRGNLRALGWLATGVMIGTSIALFLL